MLDSLEVANGFMLDYFGKGKRSREIENLRGTRWLGFSGTYVSSGDHLNYSVAPIQQALFKNQLPQLLQKGFLALAAPLFPPSLLPPPPPLAAMPNLSRRVCVFRVESVSL